MVLPMDGSQLIMSDGTPSTQALIVSTDANAYNTFYTASTSAVGNIEESFIVSVNRSLWIAVVLAALVAILLTFLISSRIFKPVKAPTIAEVKMEQGDLTQRVTTNSKDEIGEMAHAFNALADSLNRSEKLRRNLINDVAHELCTPLTKYGKTLQLFKVIWKL